MNLNIFQSKRAGVRGHLLLIVLLMFVAGLFVQNNWLWRWDNLLYDAHLASWSRTVSDDIIIIAIDDESLNELGRWPWPRSIHARLIEKLRMESPKAIGLDIIFSEPDAANPLSDVLLARAMRASGNVVLPVYMSQISNNSYPIEALPLPEFTNNAAALGHVHVDISDDGIARRVFLREGIGEPHWLHFSLALLSVTGYQHAIQSYVNPAKHDAEYSSMQWSRDHPFLIPFAGPPGHFQQIGYSQVLSGQYPANFFHDKIVLVGTTAEGLGDALSTPLSGKAGSMPGVEIIANVVDSVINDLHITELSTYWLILVTVILVALPLLIYPYLNPSSTLLVLIAVVTGTLLLAAMLLWAFGVWIHISTILLFQIISYPLWSWYRLEIAMRYINAELNALTSRQQMLSLQQDRDITEEIKFIAQFISIKGWVLLNDIDQPVYQWGDVPAFNIVSFKEKGWNIDGYRYWSRMQYDNQPCKLGLSIDVDAVITDEEIRLLNTLISTPLGERDYRSVHTDDVLRSKIQQVQIAGREYEELRQIIDDSLSGMADGVLVCSSRGQVILSNRRARWYLYGDDNASIDGKSLLNLAKHVHLKEGSSWIPLFKRVLFRRERVLTHARHNDGRDLMIEVSPLGLVGDSFDGLVVNLSDISLLKVSERKRNELLNFLSHDLRSPLSSMMALIELTKSKSSIEEIRPMLDAMKKNTQKTLHLAEQFLQLSRANTSENIRFYDIDFNSVVLNAIDQIWALSSKKKIKIEYEFEVEEIWTHAEPDLLERAVLNLLSNAIKHSEAGGLVRVSTHMDALDIVCCVMDNGSGISADELPHLFEMFRRTKGAGVERKQGIGLGLAFVDAVVKRHSGHVDVESRQGEGSSFCLRFPQVGTIEVIE